MVVSQQSFCESNIHSSEVRGTNFEDLTKADLTIESSYIAIYQLPPLDQISSFSLESGYMERVRGATLIPLLVTDVLVPQF